MKNITVYVGTIKKCLNYERYKKDGERSYIPDCKIGSLEMGFSCRNTEEINNQAILIKSKDNQYHQFKLTNTLLDNIKIVFNSKSSSLTEQPNDDYGTFVDEKTLIPYYKNQPKSLSLRKLKRDVLMDPRIKTRIEH